VQSYVDEDVGSLMRLKTKNLKSAGDEAAGGEIPGEIFSSFDKETFCIT
jgi:hypothetical protein